MRRLTSTLAVLIFLVTPGCLAALPDAGQPAAAPPAPGGDPEERLNQFLLDGPRPAFTVRVSGGSEPDILVDHAGRAIWIGDHTGIYQSLDDGATWVRRPAPMIPTLVIVDGWALAQDEDGTLFSTTTNGPIVGVFASEDLGATWNVVNRLAGVAAVADRPWLAARGDGEVALIYNSLPLGTTPQGTHCAYSTDGGRTFLVHNILSPETALAPPGVIAGNVEFGPDGGLYFAVHERFYRYATPCAGGARYVTLPPAGAQIQTQLRVDEAGHIYVAQPSANNGAMELRGYAGMDPSTLKRLVVSPPELASNTFGTIDLREGTDEIAVAFYASETAGNPSLSSFSGVWNVYVARVKGFWTDSPTITWDRLTTEPNHQGPFCMAGAGCPANNDDRDLLDYFGVDYGHDGRLHVAYGNNTVGNGRAAVEYAALDALS